MTRTDLVLLTLLICTSTVLARAPVPIAPLAIKAMIDGYFAKNVKNLEIINFGKKNGQAAQTMQTVLRLRNSLMPMKASRDIEGHQVFTEFKLNSSSILLFDSLENFWWLKDRIIFRHGTNSFTHLVYIPQCNIDYLFAAMGRKVFIEKVVFLVDERRHSIDLATSFLFTPTTSGMNVFHRINRFTRQQRRWGRSTFFIEKYKNLYGVGIDFLAKYVASYPEIYSTFAEILNFTTNIFGALESTFHYVPMSWTNSGIENFFFTGFEQRKIYIPPGEVYGDFEKMLLPFDDFTWVAIALLITFTVSMILVVKLKPIEIQRVVFGSNIRSPLMNFISILINGSQYRTMAESAPRICLAVFLFFSLIIR
jgi:hypothetical protein